MSLAEAIAFSSSSAEVAMRRDVSAHIGSDQSSENVSEHATRVCCSCSSFFCRSFASKVSWRGSQALVVFAHAKKNH